MLTALPHPAGNAIHLIVAPPAGAATWRVLRKPTSAGAIAGPADSDETTRMLALASIDRSLIDMWGLQNGVGYGYAAFYVDRAGAWLGAPDVASCAAAPRYSAPVLDPLTIVRERLRAGLEVELAAKRLAAPAGKGIPVLTAPFILSDDISFPNVSVHLDSGSSSVRAIGDDISGIGDEVGWLAATRLAVIGTAQSADARIALRMAIQRVLLANVDVFEAQGLSQIDVQWTDNEELVADSAPLFMTAFSFSCLSPALVDTNTDDGFRIGTITTASNPN